MKKAETILKGSKLRLTSNRKEVLDFLLERNYAVSHSEMEKSLTHLDRVTIYRTLNSFIEKGIVHEINDGTGASKFAICSSDCDTHIHHDEHVHFRCTICSQTVCIDSISIPTIQLPKGFTFQNSTYLINGICGACGELGGN